MTDISKKEIQTRKKIELHSDCTHWKSTLHFIGDELIFIDNLLSSYIFEPNTPNLFERLLDYQNRLKKIKIKKAKVGHEIELHEKSLGGILDCIDDACDLRFYRSHSALEAEVVGFSEKFQNLKGEIFNYAGGILKKNKN